MSEVELSIVEAIAEACRSRGMTPRIVEAADSPPSRIIISSRTTLPRLRAQVQEMWRATHRFVIRGKRTRARRLLETIAKELPGVPWMLIEPEPETWELIVGAELWKAVATFAPSTARDPARGDDTRLELAR